MPQNIYHLGFSKCGTSSVWEFWNSFAPTKSRCLRTETGAIEFDLRRHLSSDTINLLKGGGCYLKFSGAAFGQSAINEMHNIACSYGEPVYLLSVRSPKKVLTSWFNMHKKIAKNGTDLSHFAVKERDKYLAITIDEYAKEFIAKVDYSSLIKRFATCVQGSPVWILDFRKVNSGVSGVMGDLLHHLFPGIPYENKFPTRNVGSYSKESILLPPEVSEQCDRYEADLDELLASPHLLGSTCHVGA